MPESGKWLSVSQFARLAGVSPQTIYKQLSTRLSTHSKQENGSKYINSDALQLFGVSTDSAGVDNSKQPGCQPSCQPDSAQEMEQIQQEQQELDRIRAKLAQVTADRDAAREQRDKAEIRAAAADAESKRADAAEAQLSVKDKQIQQQSERIAELTAALRASQDQNKELTTALTAAQALNAGTMKMLMEKAAPDPVSASQSADNSQSDAMQQQPQERRGLFGGLFHRRKKEG